MSASFEPNPPIRKSGGFPKTVTIPENWVTDHMTAETHAAAKDPVTGQPVLDPAQAVPVAVTGRTNGRSNGHSHPAEPQPESETESPFARQLNPFPSEADLNGTWL